MAKRPSDYSDRRTDGYTEPMEIYVLGTSHASEASARDAQKVIRAVRPQSVVVEVRCYGQKCIIKACFIWLRGSGFTHHIAERFLFTTLQTQEPHEHHS